MITNTRKYCSDDNFITLKFSLHTCVVFWCPAQKCTPAMVCQIKQLEADSSYLIETVWQTAAAAVMNIRTNPQSFDGNISENV